MACAHTAAGCADTVDIGETSYAAVLADDLDNDGKMDLVLSTMNGNVYCFHTAASYHPLKAWPTPVSSCQSCLRHHCALKLVCSLPLLPAWPDLNISIPSCAESSYDSR